eukprot:9077137-Prorocentrum_lima.AAC.1
MVRHIAAKCVEYLAWALAWCFLPACKSVAAVLTLAVLGTLGLGWCCLGWANCGWRRVTRGMLLAA